MKVSIKVFRNKRFQMLVHTLNVQVDKMDMWRDRAFATRDLIEAEFGVRTSVEDLQCPLSVTEIKVEVSK